MDGVYGLTGFLYERRMPRLPRADEGHRVPSGYWKLRAIRDGFIPTVAAFILEQETPQPARPRPRRLFPSLMAQFESSCARLAVLPRLWLTSWCTIDGMPRDYAWARRILRKDEVTIGELATMLSLGRHQARRRLSSRQVCLAG